MTKQQLEKIRSLIKSYEIACDNLLYKYGCYVDDSRDCSEMIVALDNEINKKELERLSKYSCLVCHDDIMGCVFCIEDKLTNIGK